MNEKNPLNMCPPTGSPFPRKCKDLKGVERTVINEICTCGCFRTQHFNRVIVSMGHGACSICECVQFSWTGMVYGGVDDAVDAYISKLSIRIEQSPEDIEEMNDDIARLESDKVKLDQQLKEYQDHAGALTGENYDLSEKLEAVKKDLNKAREKLRKICTPLTPAKGKHRTILVDDE